MASVSHICGPGKYLDDGIVPKRFGTGLFASVPSGAYRCKDGLVYLMVNRPLHWVALAKWVNETTGNAEVLDPMFNGPSSRRQPYRELLDIFIGELTETLTVAEAYHEGQRRHLAMTPVASAADVIADAHLAARDYFVAIDHPSSGELTYPGAPYRHARTPWRLERPAPRVDQHRAEILIELDQYPHRAPSVATARKNPTASGAGALAGLRVVEFTAGMAGPWIGRFMAWAGAEVIKVESTEFPDVTRLYVPPRNPELGIQSQMSPWFTDWNAGKRFVAVDLRDARAADLCRRLVATADVVVENYSFGVLDKLGLGYDRLREAKPDLVMLSSNGYGDSGPYKKYVTWGPNIEALSGLSTLSGFEHRDCTVTQFAYPDALSALHGLVAVMAALHHRDRCGEGQYISLSQYEATVSSIGHVLMEPLANGVDPVRRGNRDANAAPQGCYRCLGDDRWCAVSVQNDAQWKDLCAVMDRPEFGDDARFRTHEARARHHDELDAIIERWTIEHSDYDVMGALQNVGIPAGVVQTVADQLTNDLQLDTRGFVERIPHALLGTVTASGVPLGLTDTPGRTQSTGAAVGADNEYVFKKTLGLTQDDYAVLLAEGVIQQP
jgi:crotonobetainyl-CoA:carnitine CoA-transferase CaiB-like acyl-CoA transferase